MAQIQEEDPYLAMNHNQLSLKVGQAESIRRVYREWNVLQYATGNKFNSWKDQMGVLFEDAGIMDLVDEIHRVPPLEDEEGMLVGVRNLQLKRHELYNLKNCLLYSLLMRSIVDTNTGAADKGDAKKNQGLQFWKNLSNQNERTETTADVMALKRAFFQLKQYAKREDVTSFANRIDRARELLIKNRQSISESDAKGTLIEGIIDPGNVKQLLLAFHDDETVSWQNFKAQTIKFVKQKLLTESTSGDKLLYGEPAKPIHHNAIPDNKLCKNAICLKKKKRHSIDKCWETHPDQKPDRFKKKGGDQNSKSSVTSQGQRLPKNNQCSHCGEMGHFPAACPKKTSQKFVMKRKGAPGAQDQGQQPAKQVNYIHSSSSDSTSFDNVEFELEADTNFVVLDDFDASLSKICFAFTPENGYSYWVYDTACPIPICNDKSCFGGDFTDSDYQLRTADKTAYESGGVGIAAGIRGVQYFPHFGANLISQTYCKDSGWTIKYDQDLDEYKLKAPYMDHFIYFRRSGKYYVAKLPNSPAPIRRGSQVDTTRIACLTTSLAKSDPSTSILEMIPAASDEDQQEVLTKLNLNFFFGQTALPSQR
jgi:hypothetical protein